MNVLVVDTGPALCGYDCRDVLDVEEVCPVPGTPPEAFVVRLGRLGRPREIRCREILGFFPILPRDIRSLPPVLRERISGEAPWAVGLIEDGLCLLY